MKIVYCILIILMKLICCIILKVYLLFIMNILLL